MSYTAENQLDELNRSVAPQVYSVYIRDYTAAVVINSTHLSTNSCFRPLTFAFFCLEFLSQLFQRHRSVIFRYVLSLFTNDIRPAAAIYAWHWRGRSRGSTARESPNGVQGQSPVRESRSEVLQKLQLLCIFRAKNTVFCDTKCVVGIGV